MTPSPYPDVKVFERDFEDERMPVWDVYLTSQVNAFPIDLSESFLSAPVLDNGEEVGQLLINREDDAEGHLVFSLIKETFDQLGRYSKWRLHEKTLIKAALLEGRIVKDS